METDSASESATRAKLASPQELVPARPISVAGCTMTAPYNQLTFADVHARAAGRWPGILSALGIEIQLNRHTPCPGCGGKDRFRFDDRDGRGTWICSGGGAATLAGDGFALIQHVRNCGPLEALRAAAKVTGNCVPSLRPIAPRKPTDRPVGRRADGLRMWSAAKRSDAAVASQLYAVRKGLKHAFGAGRLDDLIVVPIRAHGAGDVIAVQTIKPEPGRLKLTYGSVWAPDGSRGYLLLGNELDPQAPRYVAEGWATAIAIVFTLLRGNAACAVSFGKGGLEAVAEQFQRDAPPGREIIIAEDAP